MNQQEHEELVNILAEAQAIVEDGLGPSLSSSVAKDHILVQLAGALVSEWIDRREEAMEHEGVPSSGDLGRALREAEDGLEMHKAAMEVALRLTGDMIRVQGKTREREWVWDTFSYFLTRAAKALMEVMDASFEEEGQLSA
jgi:hypothetical protein